MAPAIGEPVAPSTTCPRSGHVVPAFDGVASVRSVAGGVTVGVGAAVATAPLVTSGVLAVTTAMRSASVR
ncbi:MAG: hypothetical protein KF830_12495 [Planctomycetes bacterium]|nr:hypothetical protein [Planctomycetota bacterium]